MRPCCNTRDGPHFFRDFTANQMRAFTAVRCVPLQLSDVMPDAMSDVMPEGTARIWRTTCRRLCMCSAGYAVAFCHHIAVVLWTCVRSNSRTAEQDWELSIAEYSVTAHDVISGGSTKGPAWQQILQRGFLPGQVKTDSGEKILEIMFIHNLIQIVNEYTRITSSSRSVVDLVFL